MHSAGQSRSWRKAQFSVIKYENCFPTSNHILLPDTPCNTIPTLPLKLFLLLLIFLHSRSTRTLRPKSRGKFAKQNNKLSAGPRHLQRGRPEEAALLQQGPGQAPAAEVPQCPGSPEDLLSETGGPGPSSSSHWENVRLKYSLLNVCPVIAEIWWWTILQTKARTRAFSYLLNLKLSRCLAVTAKCHL